VNIIIISDMPLKLDSFAYILLAGRFRCKWHFAWRKVCYKRQS